MNFLNTQCDQGGLSLVGPRPGLEPTCLTSARDALDVFRVKPGITGLAQINSIVLIKPIGSIGC